MACKKGPKEKKEKNESPHKQYTSEGTHPNKNPNHAKTPSQNEKTHHLKKQTHQNRNPKKLGGAREARAGSLRGVFKFLRGPLIRRAPPRGHSVEAALWRRKGPQMAQCGPQ